MKNLIVLLSVFFLQTAHADQLEILTQSRDHYLEQAIARINGYCKAGTYYCRLQIEADCKNKKKDSCENLAIVKDLEKKVFSTDEVISQIKPVPLYKNFKPDPIDEVVKEKGKVIPSTPNYKTVDIKYGAIKPQTPEGIKIYDELIELHKKINSQRIRTDCNVDAECKIQEYGAKICGGPLGTFVYSVNGGESESVLKDIALFNQKDKEIVLNYNKEYYGTCDWNGREKPATCVDKYCI